MYLFIARWLFIIMIIFEGTGMCADIPYVFGEEGGRPLEDSSLCIDYDDSNEVEENYVVFESSELNTPYEFDDTEVPLISEYDESDFIVFTTDSAPGGEASQSTSRKVSSIKNEINDNVDVDNDVTRNAAVVIAAKYPGKYNIDQITSVYEYLKYGDSSRNGWIYVSDPRGIEYYSSASNTLLRGKEVGCVGVGDCDDFAILMSALIEAIGGTTRIILAYDDDSGHAYSEVYLGKAENPDYNVEDVINWLRSKYNTKNIYVHLDPDTKDVWLNLDWGVDESGIAHPGAPFYKANKHVPLLIRENYGKVAPGLPEGFIKSAKDVSSISYGSSASSYGIIHGKVVDENNSPLISTVILTDEYGKSQLAVTDQGGFYRLNLVPGNYKLTAEKTGYYFEDIDVYLRAGRDLEITIGGVKEFFISTGVTLGDAYSWSDDESLVDYYK